MHLKRYGNQYSKGKLVIIEIKRCRMIANEKTLYQRRNEMTLEPLNILVAFFSTLLYHNSEGKVEAVYNAA